MDFIDWTHIVLKELVDGRHDLFIGDLELGTRLFGKDYVESSEYWLSKQRSAMHDAIHNLADLGAVDENQGRWQVTRLGRALHDDPLQRWEQICEQQFDEDEVRLIRLVNRFSPQIATSPDAIWLEEVPRDELIVEFGFTVPPSTNEEMDNAQKFLYSIPKMLADVRMVKDDPRTGYHNNIKATYRGLAWELRRGVTSESRFIDGLIDEWETTNVDFKRELHLDTKDEKGEFAKDVLALANTKSSGKRFLVIGFDDKTRKFHAPPDPTVTQDRIEQVLNNLTVPVVTVRYDTPAYYEDKVGCLEVIREPFKLPYRAAVDVTGEKNKKRLEKDAVYVRHGSHSDVATGIELQDLIDEGQRAKDI